MFLTPLNAVHLTGKWWQLTKPLVYHRGAFVYVVPEGFVTDFASVPRLPLVYLLTGGTAHSAAVLHDMLYRWPLVSREQADRIFYEAMEATGVWWWRRFLMLAGVRLFGRLAYRSEPGQLDPRRPNIGTNHYERWKECERLV